ncbi:ABC transporter permease subunit [Herbidospora sp. NEAU-GS84]|uniref:ABC transporter permease subunit n=1 Tax=Herbidospora solisilvae TaxID=2696284 RepID=A0A7C9NYP8_9ACTN|nr:MULTISPECIES: carbohydrate ABC transporter permease [Herbidospora]NAS20897.1 ABC transporter permease subunit [Herbidospora solisilvae]GLX93077.1 sugar ABC transporter permease [Herbidospora sp. NBRC 101105]
MSSRLTAGHVAARVVTFVILVVAAVAITAPFLWIFRGAFSGSDAELYRLPPTFHAENLTLDNFGKVTEQVPYFRFFLNSIIVSGTVTIAQLITCSTAAYAFARLRFRGKGVLFAVVIGSLMIPIQVTIVPLFLVMSKIGMTNSLWALIFPGIFSAFGIFLLRQHFMALPYELEEAAKIDGASRFHTFARVIIPLSGPSIATLGILCFTYWWNDLLLPLVMISDTEKQTLPVGLVLLAGRFSTGSLGTIAAGIAMAIVPVLIVFIAAQRYIVQSIASSGLKL